MSQLQVHTNVLANAAECCVVSLSLSLSVCVCMNCAHSLVRHFTLLQ